MFIRRSRKCPTLAVQCRYQGMYQRVANDTQAHLIPGVLEDLNDARYLYDQIHPNQAGHEILASRVAEGLQPLLEAATLPAKMAN